MTDTSLGKKIKEARLNMKITQKELAGDVITRNMLSQIENDLAMPSVKTLEHIASELNRPVSYFLGDIKNHEKKQYNSVLSDLITLYDQQQYEECINRIEEYFEDNPKSINSDILKGIYTNCFTKYAIGLEQSNQLFKAKKAYHKISDFINSNSHVEDISLFSIYSKLSELSVKLDDPDNATIFNQKADDVVNKIKHERNLQKIYVKYMSNEYDEVINDLRDINVDELTDSIKGKYFMMMGSSLFKKGKFNVAINFLHKAVAYYDNSSTVIRQLLYKELSSCYSEIEDYKKAYEFLQLSQRTHEQ